ncbi:type II toxin-antitoxin system RelE/ParE family toxin [Leptolyngbya sp. NIES-2104]|uniref:type II toxin-antitoxin system RelE/ParE family toxin n=1 Tax=Leptolyngbya sp. NIES-2104 TaxID=1552121 RepID=UPI0006EC63F1|nr:type II toxin-antitoxin system RelE/ParE family toxin [Leptolyngbya sp. NIES-2104]GAP97791.1 death on curing protein, Doc toxin [Leptolyngbya sp. NIES-2104]
MRVVWTEIAINQLQGIYDYIAQTSIAYADQTVDRLTRRSQQIASFPRSGRMVPEFQDDSIREVIENPYRLIYRILPEQIDVIAVVHGSQIL